MFSVFSELNPIKIITPNVSSVKQCSYQTFITIIKSATPPASQPGAFSLREDYLLLGVYTVTLKD